MKKSILIGLFFITYLSIYGQDLKWNQFAKLHSDVKEVKVNSYDFFDSNLFENFDYELEDPTGTRHFVLGVNNLITSSRSILPNHDFPTTFTYSEKMRILEIDNGYRRTVYEWDESDNHCVSKIINSELDTILNSELFYEGDLLMNHKKHDVDAAISKVEYIYDDDTELVELRYFKDKELMQKTTYLKIGEDTEVVIKSRKTGIYLMSESRNNGLSIISNHYKSNLDNELYLVGKTLKLLDEKQNPTKIIYCDFDNNYCNVKLMEYLYVK